MKRFGWRLLFVVAFIPLGLLPVLWSFGCIMTAGMAWLLLGPAGDGKDRSDRWGIRAHRQCAGLAAGRAHAEGGRLPRVLVRCPAKGRGSGRNRGRPMARERRWSRGARRVMLVLLSGAPRLSGYPISRAGMVGSGTAYPALARMEKLGWVEGEWETPNPLPEGRRRFYRLTDEGRERVTDILGLPHPDRSGALDLTRGEETPALCLVNAFSVHFTWK